MANDTKFTKLKGSTLRTPKGIARYCYINRPDDSKYGKGRFKLTVVMNKKDPEYVAFGKTLKALAKAHAKAIGCDAKDSQFPIKLVDEKMSKGKKGKKDSKGTGDEIGLPLFKCDMNSSFTGRKGNKVECEPTILNVQGKEEDLQVYSGDIVRAEVRVVGWELDGDFGLKLMLNAVKQLKSNWTGGSGNTLTGGDEEFLNADDDEEETEGEDEDNDADLTEDEDEADEVEDGDETEEEEDEGDPPEGDGDPEDKGTDHLKGLGL